MIFKGLFQHEPVDQASLGCFWNKVNVSATGTPVRNAEWIIALYYSYSVMSGLQVTPDLQVYLNPALHPGSGTAFVLTFRVTASF